MANTPKRTKLTDKQKKKIIADYAETGNYSETGRLNGVSDTTVKSVVDADKDTLEKVEQKKEENTQDLLEYLETKTEKQKKVIDLSLEALEKLLTDPDKKTSIRDIALAYGVIIDKALKFKELNTAKNVSVNIEDLTPLADLLKIEPGEAECKK